MLGIFSPRCPLEISIKAWIERRFQDLAAVIGSDRIRQVEMITPGHSDLPESFSGSEQDLMLLFTQLCRWMDLVPEAFQLATAPDVQFGGASGAYIGPQSPEELPRIIVAESLPGDPDRLLATLSYLIAHEVVRTKFPDIAGSQDSSWAIDIVPALYGLGVYAANSLNRGGVGGCGSGGCSSCGPDQTATKGVMTPQNYGHVLALLAWARHEVAPAWANTIQADVAHTMKPSLKYLNKTGDCVFNRDDFGKAPTEHTTDQFRENLQGSLKTQQFEALRGLVQSSQAATELASEIDPFLRHREVSMRRQAAAALSAADTLSSDTFLELLRLIDDSEGGVRGALTYALRPGCAHEDMALESLMKLLNDPNLTTAGLAATALAEFDDLPKGALDGGLKLLRRGVAKCNDDVIDAALHFLKAQTDDVEALVAARFNDDEDVLTMVQEHLHPDESAGENLALPVISHRAG